MFWSGNRVEHLWLTTRRLIKTTSKHQRMFTTGSKVSDLVRNTKMTHHNIIDTQAAFSASKLPNPLLRRERTAWLCLILCICHRALCVGGGGLPQCDFSKWATNERQAYRRWSIDWRPWWLIWMLLNAGFHQFHCHEGYLLQLVSHTVIAVHCQALVKDNIVCSWRQKCPLWRKCWLTT